MSTPTIFFLGATGYLGSQLLIYLARDLPQYHIVALVRPPTIEKEAGLKAIYSNLSIVEGTLNDDAVIQEQAAKADIVINTASSDHFPSVVSTLAGLEKNSADHPGKPPLYIHVSGLGITSDNARGEPVDISGCKEHVDISFNLDMCPAENQHLDSLSSFQDGSTGSAKVRMNNQRSTSGQIITDYAALGFQKITLPVRLFMDLSKKLGFAGTWGPGANVMRNIHVRDVASACLAVFKAALEGKADEGAEGFYFAISEAPMISIHDWTARLGDILYNKGAVKQPGARPMPPEVTEPLGEYGWSLFGGNQLARPGRLYRLGWQPTETAKKTLLECLPEEVDVVLVE